MKKTIGIFAHVDAGKTTFSEQILYHGGAIRKTGRVDNKNTFLDFHSIEKQRGITVFSEEAVFDYNDCTYYLADTPGHVDFMGEAGRCISVLDYAILIISAVEGVQGHTITLWNMLLRFNIPVVFFINKTDRIGADIKRVTNEISTRFSNDSLIFTDKIDDSTISDELVQYISMFDEALMEKYFNDKILYDDVIYKIQELLKQRKIFPILYGSALNDIGINEFLKIFDKITVPYQSDKKEFSALIYKVRHINSTRRCYLKVLSGELSPKDIVNITDCKTGEIIKEKINDIKIVYGNKLKPIDRVTSGDICSVSGISSAKSGQYIGDRSGIKEINLIPTLSVGVLFDEKYFSKTVYEYFKIIEDEDSSLKALYDEENDQIQLHIMGKIQTEILKDIFFERFGIEINFTKPKILYKETIKGEVLGCGHYEPLRHYAEVHLLIKEGKRNSGIKFSSDVHVDVLAQSYQSLVKTHVFEKQHRGVLCKMPLTDVEIILKAGRAHEKHTEGGDFRQAVYRAIRQGLMKSQKILLEPYYKFSIQTPTEYIGRILSDLEKFHADFSTPIAINDEFIINGTVPVSEFMDYDIQLKTISKGMAHLITIFDGYRECHNTQEVIKEINYDPERDPDNSADSIFCSHGAGFHVKWDEADKYMHLL